MLMPIKPLSKPEKTKLKVTISIVSYNTKDKTLRCLKSIYQHTSGINFEVIVVDNNSQDGTAEAIRKQFKQVKLIASQTNLWHSGGHNLSFSKTTAPYFYILNSDVFFTNNSIKSTIDYLDSHPDVGAVEPCEVNDQGEVVPNGSMH